MKKFSLTAISGVTVALIVSLASCTSRNSQIDSSKLEREPINYEVITDSIYTSMLGDFIYTGRYVVWADVVQSFSVFEGNFIHVVDPELKKEVVSMGRKGNGPNEFNTPDVIRYNGDTVYVRDLNMPRQVLISLPDAVEGRKPIIPLAPSRDTWEGAKLFITKESQVHCNPDYKDTPFRYINGTDTIPFGQYVINLDIERVLRMNFLQMSIEYDADLEMLVCNAGYFPYVALYKKTGNSFELMTEVKGEIDYTMSDGWVEFSRKGFLRCKLTKNYLVTLDYDYDKGEQPPHGHDKGSVPHTLFVRDHNGNLLRIFQLDEPTLSLTSCGKDNILYAIIAPQDPDRDESESEYELVRIDLGEAMGK